MTNPADRMPLVNIYQPADDVYDVVVEHADQDQFPGQVHVDLSPVPTWPSPSECNDLIANAVRKVLDDAWLSATGEPIERTPQPVATPPVEATPYLIQIRKWRDGQPVESITLADAEEAASMISPYPDRTEPIDPEHGFYNVWLPDYMTKHAWETGIDLDLKVGGYWLLIEMDPA